jgi:large repetitive protein
MRRFGRVSAVICSMIVVAVVLRAALPQVPTGTWQPGGSLLEPRTGAASVLLSDGTILTTGGTNSVGASQTAELLRPDGSMSAVASMTTARSRHTATVLDRDDGRVLVVGGLDATGAPTNTAEEFDPVANTWSPVGNLQFARSGQTATQMDDGRVLIVGGENNGAPVAAIEAYDPATQTFTTLDTLKTPRKNHAAVSLDNGMVLITGGSGFDNQRNPVALSSTEIFNPTQNKVGVGAGLNTARASLTATKVIDGNVVVAGGTDGTNDLASIEIYDTNAAKWSLSAASLANARSGHVATLLPNSYAVLISGGTTAGAPQQAAEMYRLWNDDVVSAGTMTGPRVLGSGAPMSVGGPGMSSGIDGLYFAVGGSASMTTEFFRFATIRTDAGDYAPGTTVYMSGTGFAPGETVYLHLHEEVSDSIIDYPNFIVTAGSDGSISYSAYAPTPADLYSYYHLTALGQSSGLQAQTTFHDAPAQKTCTIVTSSLNPSAFGQSVTFTGTLYIKPTSATPCTSSLSVATTATGNLSFKDGNSALGTGTLSNGQATFSTSTLSAASHSITADYAVGDSNFASSNPNTVLTQTVNAVAADGSGTMAVNPTSAIAGSTGNSFTFNFTGPANDFNSGSQVALTIPAGWTSPCDASVNSCHAGSITIAPAAVNGCAAATLAGISGSGPWTVTANMTCAASKGFTIVYDGNGSAVTAPSTAGPYTFTTKSKQSGGTLTNLASSPVVTVTGVAPAITSANNATFTFNSPGTFTITATGTPAPTFSETGALPTGVSLNSTTGVLSGTPAPGTVGSYPITITASNGVSPNATQSFTLTVQKANQASLSVTGMPASPAAYGSTFTAGTSGGSGTGAVTFASTGPCSVDANTGAGSITGSSGTCSVTATKAADTNYNVATSAAATTTATTRAITVTAAADSKTYDGTTSSSATPTVTSGSLASGDTGNFSETYDTKHVGTTKTLTPSGTVTAGATDKTANYQITFTPVSTGVISARAITVTAATDSKTYDGATSSAGVPTITLGSLASGDTATWTQTFDTKNVGTGKTLTPAGSVSDGNSGNDYAVTLAGNTTGAITARSLQVTATTETKPYDGTTSSSKAPTLTSGTVASGDTANFTQAFDNANAGARNLVPSGSVTDGNSGNNYSYTFVNTAGSIDKVNANVSVTAYDVTYDGNPHTATGSATGIHGETLAGLTLSGTTHTNAGTYGADPWSFTDVTGNYNNASGTASDHIGRANASIVVTPYDVTYNGSPHTATGAATGIGGVVLAGLDLSGTVHTTVGNYTDTWTFTDVTGNYNNAGSTVNDAITQATPVITWSNPADIAYGTALGATQLNATASVPGSFVYTPAAGTLLGVGSAQALKSDFTPADATNYTVATATVHINVTKSTPTIVWRNPADINYGTALGNTQLNALALPAYAPRGWWKAEGDAADASPAANNGTVHGGTTYTTGVAGQAFSFPDASGDGVTVPHNAGYNVGAPGFAASFYVKGNKSASTYEAVLEKSHGFIDATGWAFQVEGVTGHMRFAIGNGTGFPEIVGSADVLDGNYHLVVGNWDSTTSTMTLYVDGASQGTATNSTPANNTRALNIGFAWGGGTPQRYFQGSVDEVQIFGASVPAGTYTYNPASGTVLNAADDQALAVTFDPTDTTNLNSTTGSAKINVKKTVLTITASSASVNYGGAAPTITPSYSGFVNGDGTSVLTTPPNCSTTYSQGSHVSGSPYSTTCSGAAAPNYSITYANGAVTVNPVALTITAPSPTVDYGAAVPTLTPGYSGFVNGDTAGSLSTAPNCSTNYTQGSHVSGNPYATSCTGAVDSDYTISYQPGTLTVHAVQLTVTANAQTKKYGDSDPALTYNATGFKLTDAAATVLTGSLTRAAGESVAGSPYAITQGTLASNSDYTISFTGANLAITPATLTVTADDKTKQYGDSDPALTYQSSGFKLTDTAATVLTGALTRAAGESVAGSPYGINQGTLAANSNYTISFTGANLTITPAPLTVHADPKTKQYGDSDPALTYQSSGFKLTDTAATVLTGALTRAAGDGVAGSPYAISQGSLAANSNYTISFTGANLTITPAELTIHADAKTKQYGDSDPALTYQSSGFKLTDTAATVLTGGLSRTAGESVAGGPYAINQGMLAANSNYTISFTGANLTITPAELTIHADAKTKQYGDTDPALTYQSSGFKLTDTAATVLTGGLSRTAGESVAGGPYSINQGMLAANSNYIISFTGSLLTITARPITVTPDSAQNKVYGYNDPALTYKVTSGTLVNDDGFTGALSRAAGQNVGSYAIVQGTLTAGSNYNITFTSGVTFGIAQRPITVTAAASTKVYDGTTGSTTLPTYPAGSLAYTDTPNFVETFATRNVGSGITLTPSGTVNDGNSGNNYSYTFVPANAGTITARAITAIAVAYTKSYDGTVNCPIVSGSSACVPTIGGLGLASGDTANFTETFDSSSAGNRTLTPSGKVNDGNSGNNYSYTYQTAAGVITLQSTSTAISFVSGNYSSLANPVPSTQSNSYTVQYSDPVNFTVLIGTSLASTDTTGSLTITATPQAGGSSLPLASSPVSTSGGGQTLSLPTAIGLAPGTYTITATFVSSNGNFSGSGATAIQTLTVIKEDARATYTGALYASTSSSTSTSATVTLAATIQDITAVTGDPAHDDYPGDIRNATVTFVNRDANNAVLGTAPIGLVNLGDIKVGTATTNVTMTVGSCSTPPCAQSYTIGIIVSGHYTRNSSDDNTVITVAQPGTNFISGGGYVALTNSGGVKAGDAGSKNNFGLNVKYNKSGSNLQGNINTIIRRTESDGIQHVYQIKGNSMTSLSVNQGASSGCANGGTAANPCTATFNGKASIQDITDPNNVISVDGNATLQVDMTDYATSNGQLPVDMIGVTVWSKSGGMWFSNNWTGTKTAQQSLGGGNLSVH